MIAAQVAESLGQSDTPETQFAKRLEGELGLKSQSQNQRESSEQNSNILTA
jgi:hypothetical protein